MNPVSPVGGAGTLLAAGALCILLATAAACGDEADFVSPGLGDFVEDVNPDAGEELTADKFGNIAVSLNFFPGGSELGLGELRSFRLDGDEVRTDARIFPGEGDPPTTALLTYEPPDIDEGQHDVQVEYSDSRGLVHRVRWTFRIEG